jgi:ureidoglycolate lyase
MTRIVTIPVREMTPETFAPYGELLAAREGDPDFQGLQSVGWQARYQVTGGTLVYTLRSFDKGLRFTMFERHFDVSQTFIPLGGTRGLVAVAPPTGDDPPDPEQVVGFIVDCTCGYVLNPGTWHSLDRYPLDAPHIDVVMITGERTQHDIVNNPPERMQLSEQVDYANRFGVEFEFDVED